ncbi:hypothetical protein B0A49_02941 [Cryomyces minteri]|uniref:Peroxin-3 n=1 Tax=Cryomyces minteri TaxID=331657 RepID=A0A4U0XIA4_9PEZI|nr:hypothetical protein B0A49_02941 [Cryomyces minteri]
MIATTRRWFRRNRANLAIGAGLLGAGYLAGQYVLNKVSEARQRMSDDRIAKENLRRRFEQNQEDCTFTVLALLPTIRDEISEQLPVEQITSELQQKKAERLAKSIAGTSDIGSADFPSGPPSVGDEDGRSMSSFKSESYVHASQMGESSVGVGDGLAHVPHRSKKSKVQLWNDMKIASITRAFTLLYSLALLTLLTRIQLNLLGRRNYLSSVVSLASPPKPGSRISLENNDDDNYEHAYGNDFETNRKYLTFSWWLLHRGCKEVMNKVMLAVKEVFGPLNPREDITLERLSELTLEVRKKVEGATEEERRESKWLSFLLPPRDQEEFVLQESGMSTSPASPAPADLVIPSSTAESPSLRRLLDETADLIDSPPFMHVFTLLLDAGFSRLIDDKISQQAYKIPPVSASDARVQEIVGSDVRVKLANSLAVFCRQAHAIGAGNGGLGTEMGVGGGNEYLATMESVRDLEAFAAVVYSSNFEFEAAEAGSMEPNGSAEASADPKIETSRGDQQQQQQQQQEQKQEQELVTETVTETKLETLAQPEDALSLDQVPNSGEDVAGEASLVSGAESSLETAWGRALAKEDGIKLEPDEAST